MARKNLQSQRLSLEELQRREEELLQVVRQLEKANQYLSRLSFVDSLTDVANRRYLEVALDQEWARSRRESRPLSLILIDIDRFKLFNDAHGHQVGDECLKRVSKALKTNVKRPGDLVGRYGGEEFMVILAETEMDGALHLADRLRKHIRQLRIPLPDSAGRKRVTVSLGVATAIPAAESTVEELIATADRALYAAKHSGRDRVEGLRVPSSPPRSRRRPMTKGRHANFSSTDCFL